MHNAMSRDEMDLDGNDDVSPYSERATPPYLVWARDLQYILNDYEGMNLFKSFLAQTNCDNELTFWYACEGLKKNLPKDRIAPTAKGIFADFIRTRGEKCLQCIDSKTRSQTQLAINSNEINEHVFDFVQREVECSLRKKHEEFVQSDTYLFYLQAAQANEGLDSATYYENDSPNSSSNSSSNSGDVLRPTSSLLPTLHEDIELESISEKMARYSDADTIRIEEEYETSTMEAGHHRTLMPAAAAASVSSYSNPTTLMRDDRKQRPPTMTTKRGESDAVLRDYNNQNTTVEKRKQAQTASQKLTHSTLVKTLGQRMHSAIPSSHTPGMPPHPYHTTKTYVPHLNTSAQDSELQSMSSDAATESSISGTNFRYHDRSAKKYAQLNVVEKADFIPRTQRNEPPPRNMTDEKFREEVVQKLVMLCQNRKKDEKLRDVLKAVTEPENQPNMYRAAVEQFSKVEKAVVPDIDESILEDHCLNIGWQDTPPVRSPGFNSAGFNSAGRRRSPGSKSPDRRVSSNRMMTASYPVTFTGGHVLTQNQQGFIGGVGGRPMLPVDQNLHWATQSAMLPQNQLASGSPRHRNSAGVPSHSASNTLHRHGKLSAEAQMQIDFNQHLADKQRSVASIRPKFPPVHHPAFSDTSGISSSTSTQVSTDPSVFGPNISSGAKPKCRSTGTVPMNVNVGVKSHKTSANPKTSSGDKTKMQKNNAADLNVQMRKMNLGGGATTTNVGSTMSGTSSAGQNFITVVYVLPNEPTPFLTKICQNQLTLKQFKGILAKRQGSFKYHFKCASDNGREVWEEVTNDNEIVPFHGLFKVEARVDIAD